MGVVLKAENVAIRYITGDFKDIGLKEYTMRRLTGNYQVKEFRAVDGVSFELHEGDMLGIIGSNGAGKSTLLKAVAGIMEPTQGKITANGDVAALLELGSGFDGDLTVKENAYLRGAMLGYTKEFMDETYERIIDFSELKEFENRPFKQLSSGMKSRLAFSIASLVRPDILILDEVLSVGDGAFQEKSAKKMREIISQGATTILVSHSLEQIRELCNKVLWLDHGRQVAFGDSAEICDRYEAFLRGECPAEMLERELAEQLVENHCIAVYGRESNSKNINAYPARIDAFDGLKGIMCVLIAMYHFSNEYTSGVIFRNSFLCVESFFVLSGFLLMQTCYRKVKRFDIWSIIKQRIAKLYPAYLTGLVFLVGLFSVTWFSGNPFAWLVSNDNNRSALLTELLGLQTIGLNGFNYINYPAWYVSALFISTVLILFIYQKFKQNVKMFYKLAALICAVGFTILYSMGVYEYSIGFWLSTPFTLPLIRGLAAMCLGACLFGFCIEINWTKFNCKLLYLIMYVSLLAMLHISIFMQPTRWNIIYLLLLVGLIITNIGLSYYNRGSILTCKLLRLLGKVSYWFFILQSFSQNIISIYISQYVQNIRLLAVLFIVINLLVSVFCYLVIEKKIFQKIAANNNLNNVCGGIFDLGRVTSIDGLRGILAVIIALFHFGQVYGVGNTFHRGYFAVEVFFMLSGFLLANKIAKTTGSISILKDIVHRLRHLYPIYFISIIFLVMLYSVVWFNWNPIAWINSESSHFISLLSELLCIQVSGIGQLIYVNGPIWYVSALLLSILIIMIIYKYLPNKFSKIVIGLLTVTIYVLFYILDPHMNASGFFANTQIPSPLLRGVAGLGLGCCLYWIYCRYIEKGKKCAYLNYYAIISCILLILPLVVTEPSRSNYLLFIPAAICILTMFWLGEEGKFPILNSKPLQYLGKISYTFFVMQSFSQNFVSIIVANYITDKFTLNIIYLAVNLLLSAILYPIFEVYIPRKLCNSSVQKIS